MVVAEFLLDAVDGQDGMERDGVVVSFEGDARAGERADHGDGLVLHGIKREEVFSFFSSTIDSRAARKASSACFGRVRRQKRGWYENGTCCGGSNMPSLMRAVKRRLTETSSWASVSRPLWTASVSLRYFGAAIGVGAGEDTCG